MLPECERYPDMGCEPWGRSGFADFPPGQGLRPWRGAGAASLGLKPPVGKGVPEQKAGCCPNASGIPTWDVSRGADPVSQISHRVKGFALGGVPGLQASA